MNQHTFEWQTHDTAPRDGTMILVCFNYPSAPRYTTIRWDHNNWNLIETGSYAGDGLFYEDFLWTSITPPTICSENY